MAETVRDALLLALDDLVENSFKRFRNKLMDCNIKSGKKKISKSKLEKADREDTVGLILDCYEEYGAELTLDVLEAIDENRVASNLKKNLEKVKERKRKNPKEEPLSTSEVKERKRKKPNEEPPSTSEVKERKRKKPKEEPPSTSEASSSPAPKPREKHFVDKHEKALIARVALVAPILDDLKSKDLLRDEQYDTIGAEKTSQKKMRKLYKITKEFSKSDKDTFYEILKENNGPLIKDLEEP